MATAKATKSKKKATKNGAVNKAEEIRKAAKEIGGKKVRPKDVIELLATRGIVVSPPQVSSTLKAAGYRRIRHRKAAASAKHPHAANASGGLSLEHLIAAKVLLGKVGSVAAAKKAIEAMAKLS